MAASSFLSKIQLNCDMGESFGRWKLADDEGIMPNIDACNAAAGFHASDPSTLHATVRLAKKHCVDIGAHPGFPDLAGFGRRPMTLSADEVADIITYQAGAVQAFCHQEGVKLAHIKPHGALYFYLLSDRAVCQAAVRAVKSFGVPLYGLPNTLHEEVANQEGVAFVPEIFVDIEYTSDGNLIPPAKSKKMTPEECAQRVRSVIETDTLPAQASNKPTPALKLKSRPFSVCLHSDMQGALENVLAVRKTVDELNRVHYE